MITGIANVYNYAISRIFVKCSIVMMQLFGLVVFLLYLDSNT